MMMMMMTSYSYVPDPVAMSHVTTTYRLRTRLNKRTGHRLPQLSVIEGNNDAIASVMWVSATPGP